MSVSDIGKYVPDTALESFAVSESEFGTYKVEYTLDQPADMVQQTLTKSFEKGSPDFSSLFENSEIEISAGTGNEQSLGGGGSGALVGQKIGFGLEGTVTRTSEVSEKYTLVPA